MSRISEIQFKKKRKIRNLIRGVVYASASAVELKQIFMKVTFLETVDNFLSNESNYVAIP